MRKHRTPEQWQALVNQQRDSGLSASKFCKQENIGYASFCNWRKRLSDQAAGDSADSGEAGFLDLSSLMSLMGAAQSGARSSLRLLRVVTDADLIARARSAAEDILASDPALLSHRPLSDEIERRVGQQERAALAKN